MLPFTLESLRFKDVNEYEYEIELKVLARVLKKKRHPRKTSFFNFFSAKKLVWLFIMKEVKPFPDSKMIKLLTVDNLFSPLRYSR